MKPGKLITDLRSRYPLTLSIGLRLRQQLRQITQPPPYSHDDWLELQFDPLKVWSLQPLWLLDDLFFRRHDHDAGAVSTDST